MTARAREVGGGGPGVLLERNQEGIMRCDFEGGGGRASESSGREGGE